ncbi:MAG TPA: branched-chain amino acid ABC transporter permease [Roseiarcus sp.]
MTSAAPPHSRAGGNMWLGAIAAIALALAVTAPFIINAYGLYLVTLTGIFGLVALGLNFLVGYAGQISLCHAAFFGVGAYATALLTQKAGVPYVLSLFLAGLFTTAIGALVAVPALRLRSLYLAIASLGFGVVLQRIIFEWRSLTGGGGGMQLPAATVAGRALTATGLYELTIALLGIGLYVAHNISRGRTGRALLLIRESETAAGALGISAARYKITAFAISAFYAAVAGGLFAYLVRYINPESFNVGLSIAFLSMVVIGGLGAIGGSIVGAIFYVLVPELLRGFNDAPGLVFGALLVIVMVFMPRGLWGMGMRLARRE